MSWSVTALALVCDRTRVLPSLLCFQMFLCIFFCFQVFAVYVFYFILKVLLKIWPQNGTSPAEPERNLEVPVCILHTTGSGNKLCLCCYCCTDINICCFFVCSCLFHCSSTCIPCFQVFCCVGYSLLECIALYTSPLGADTTQHTPRWNSQV